MSPSTATGEPNSHTQHPPPTQKTTIHLWHPHIHHTPITAPWLLTAPRHIRIKFLQGFNDGDGYANTKYQKLGNACDVNSPFLIEFLLSLGINSRFLKNRVIIEQQVSVIYAAELPFFLHATGRQEQANKLSRMMAARALHARAPITEKAEYYIRKLSKQGKSPGEIVEFIFDELGICYYPRRIRKIIKT